MKNLIKKATVILATLPAISFAQLEPTVPTTNIRSLTDVTARVVRVVNWFTGLFFVVAILFLFWAAFLYLGAAGDPERLKQAKNQLIYSLIAIVVALLAGSVRFVVENVLK